MYMSPERLKGKDPLSLCPGYGLSTDIWGCGIVLYMLLSATVPWNEENLDTEIQNSEIPCSDAVWNDVPALVLSLVHWLLAKSPTFRPTSSELLEIDWLQSE